MHDNHKKITFPISYLVSCIFYFSMPFSASISPSASAAT